MRKKQNTVIIFWGIVIISIGLAVGMVAWGANEGRLNYGSGPVVDSDLDGLTDKGEQELYNTDPDKADSDGDGILDGAEILSNTDPLNSAEPSSIEKSEKIVFQPKKEVPWSWYVTRAAGIIAYLFLFLSFVVGLAIRIRFFKKILGGFNYLSFHCWVSAQALAFSVIHAVALLFDKYLKLSLADIFIPFVSDFQPIFFALGIFGIYLMIIMVISSYLRKKISFALWRALHYLSVILYLVVAVHTYYLGTDLKDPIILSIFIGMNFLLVVMVIWHVIERRRLSAIRKNF